MPLLHVCGDADETVPIEENTRVLESRYKQLGGKIEVIVKPGVGHHPHALKDPTPIVEFVLKHTASPRASRRRRSSGWSSSGPTATIPSWRPAG